MPVCTSMRQVVNCMNDLRRFMLAVETRFSNLQGEVKASDYKNQLDKDAQSKEIDASQREQEKKIERHSKEEAKYLRRVLDEREEVMTRDVNKLVWEKQQQETTQVKQWCNTTIKEKFTLMERKIINNFDNKIKDLQKGFLVKNLIGADCEYRSLSDYVTKECQSRANIYKKIGINEDKIMELQFALESTKDHLGIADKNI